MATRHNSGRLSDMELKLKFDTREKFGEEWKKNISKGGLFLQTEERPEMRSRVTVSIEVLDLNRKIELCGEVVHVSPAGVGVQLDPLPEDVVRDIESVLTLSKLGEKKEASPSLEGDVNLHQAIQNMSRHERLALARKGGINERAVLMRNRDPAVVMNVLLNPRITVSEIIQLTKSKGLTLEMIKQIARKADWVAVEDIKLNLVMHPKTPQPTALSLLKTLSQKNLRMLAKRPIKAAIKRAALKMVIQQ